MGVSIIIRSIDETTLPLLKKQLLKQKSDSDNLYVLNDPIPFERKLEQSFRIAIEDGSPFCIMIDADVLVIPTFLKKVKIRISQLPKHELGFGLKVLDRFYGRPKPRGISVYNARHLTKALGFIPETGRTLRPESFVKIKLGEIGHPWQNRASNELFGIHDFFQKPQDIFCKMAIRSHRNKSDVDSLMTRFQNNLQHIDFIVGAAALKYGLSLEGQNIDNSRDNYLASFKNEFSSLRDQNARIPFLVKTIPGIYVWVLIILYNFKLIPRFKG